jgi:hypothetical protein
MSRKTYSESPVNKNRAERKRRYKAFDDLRAIVIHIGHEEMGLIWTPTRHLRENGMEPSAIVADIVSSFKLYRNPYAAELSLTATRCDAAIDAAVYLQAAAMTKPDGSHLLHFHAVGGNA